MDDVLHFRVVDEKGLQDGISCCNLSGQAEESVMIRLPIVSEWISQEIISSWLSFEIVSDSILRRVVAIAHPEMFYRVTHRKLVDNK